MLIIVCIGAPLANVRSAVRVVIIELENTMSVCFVHVCVCVCVSVCVHAFVCINKLLY